jgi:hypothetical protein
MQVTAIRIYRARNSTNAILVGGTRTFPSLIALADWSRKQHKVYAYSTDAGKQGIMRSGRMMRFVDLHVRNTPPSFDRMIIEYLEGDDGGPLTINVPKVSF